MRAFLRRASLVALAALVTAGAVRAQVGADGVKAQSLSMQRVGGITASDSLGRILKMDASGNLKTVDADRDRDYWTLLGAVDDTLGSGTALGSSTSARLQWTAESTTVAAAYPYKRFAVAIRIIPIGGDTTNVFKLAVQVRKHTAAVADSANTFGWYSWVAGNTAAVADSIGHNYSGTFSSGAGQQLGPWPSERVFTFQPWRGRGDLKSAQTFGWPNGVMVDLIDSNGQWFWAPYISVRVRNLLGPTGCRVILKLYGGA